MEQHLKPVFFFDIVSAFQAFGGKSLKCLDSAKVLTDEEIETMRAGLARLAEELDREDPTEYADLHRLAAQIRKCVARIPARAS